MFSRRQFLSALSAAPWAASLAAFDAFAEPERGRARIADLRVMILQGPRTYTLVKVISDAGVFGIGEGYGSPAIGIKEGVLDLRSYFIGKDPLEIEALLNGLSERIEDSPDVLPRAASAIEMALWDLAGKLLNQPVATLLGGAYRDRVRVFCDDGPANMLDRLNCNEWADQMKKDPAGWTAFRVSLPHASAKLDVARDHANHALTVRDIRDIRQAFEYCRDAIGWDSDLIVNCGTRFDLRSAMELTEALAAVKPLWLEDPLPAEYSPNWPRLSESSKVRIAAGESLTRRAAFQDFVVNRGCDVVEIDLRNAGGLLESKKIAGLAEWFGLMAAARNSGSVWHTMATVQWAAAVRDFQAAETLAGRRNWMDEVIVHEGPLVAQGYIKVPRKPGFGVELNPEVVKANLAAGERYWE